MSNPIIERNPDLKIHPRLASFLKRWGFTRDSENKLFDGATFTAIVKGKVFRAYFDGNQAFYGLRDTVTGKLSYAAYGSDKVMNS